MRVSGIPFIQGRNSNGTSTKYAIAIHNTSNPGATADDEAAYAQRRTDGVGSHFYADVVKVIQSNDTDRRVGHAGSATGNSYAIAVEITGANGWTRQQWLTHVDWAELGAVLAQVCRAHGIPAQRRTVAEMQANPKVRGFYGHDDMRRAWGGTTHTDPGGNFPWDHLLAAVSDAMGGTTAPTSGDDMGFNAQQKADAAFNLTPKVTLDTDGSDNGGGSLRDFDSPLYLAIRGLLDRVEQLEQRPTGDGTAAPVDLEALAELVAGKLVERLKA